MARSKLTTWRLLLMMGVVSTVVVGGAVQYGRAAKRAAAENLATEIKRKKNRDMGRRTSRYARMEHLSDKEFVKMALQFDDANLRTRKLEEEGRRFELERVTDEERRSNWEDRVAQLRQDIDKMGNRGANDPHSVVSHMKKQLKRYNEDAPREARQELD